MSGLPAIARKLGRSFCFVTVHFDKTLPKIGSEADCAVCDERTKETLEALQAAVKDERKACATVALEFTAAPTDPEQEQTNDTAEAIAEAIEERGT